MTTKDLPSVLEIQSLTLHLSWSQKVWMSELIKNQMANHYVAKKDDDVVGYAGFWLILDEANLVNIAVHPGLQKMKIGYMLMKNIVNTALKKGAKFMTLEVRCSNKRAIKLYENFNFKIIAIRKKYYQNPEENGYVMWVNPLKKHE